LFSSLTEVYFVHSYHKQFLDKPYLPAIHKLAVGVGQLGEDIPQLVHQLPAGQNSQSDLYGEHPAGGTKI
jgi:hypothetical protein